MVNFILGDFVARINNAKRQHFNSICVPNSKIVKKVIELMLSLGILRNMHYENSKNFEIFLKYNKRRCVFKHLKLISVPSRRVYIDLVDLARLKNKTFTCIYILSTNYGLKTDFECLLEKISGELLLKIEF